MLVCICSIALSARAHAAITPIPTPSPSSNSYGLEASKTQPAPTEAATISTPGSGSSFTTSPITISGLCKTDLLVQVYDNSVLVGSVDCKSGSFSLQVSLFSGQNELTAIMYDDLDQAGPVSNTVTVSYSNASFSAFGELITLTSNYARRAASPGTALSWPLILSGGTGPYAFSLDWGDGGAAELKSQSLTGIVTIGHTYKQPGIYHVTVKVTDVNGVTAFLQLVAVANGTPTKDNANGTITNTTIVTKVVWIPAVLCVLLLLPAFWLGQRSELVKLHRKAEKDMAEYNKKEKENLG